MGPTIEIALFLSRDVCDKLVLDFVNWIEYCETRHPVNVTCYVNVVTQPQWSKFLTYRNYDEFPQDAHIYEIVFLDVRCIRGAFRNSYENLFNVRE